MKLVEIWVKAPLLKDASLLLAGECVQAIYPELFKKFSKGRVVLTNCPEAEGSVSMGKLASIVTCSAPKEITVLTVEGSPHCYTLHAAVNEALFVANSDLKCRHFVIVDGRPLEVSPESVRLGRYLHLSQKCIDENPKILDELAKFSLEHRKSLKKRPAISGKKIKGWQRDIP